MDAKSDITESISKLAKGRSAAIFGAGVSAFAVKELLDSLGIESRVYAEGAARHSEKNLPYESFDSERAKEHALVIYSPAFRPDCQWIKIAESAGALAICETDLSALAWNGKIIAVTGTNGKTTLTKFLTHALNRHGYKAEAVGNIGKPLCALCAETLENSDKIAIYELSSFQTSKIKFLKPDALAWTNFAEDHLDWHTSMTEYFEAKNNIRLNLRSPIMFAGESVQKYAREFGIDLPKFAEIVPEDNLPPAPPPFDSAVQSRNYEIAKRTLAAFGISESQTRDAAKDFQLPAHRFSTPIEANGVKFYNDSKATNAHAAIAALRAMRGIDRNLIWLGGGKDKFCPLEELTQEILASAKGAIVIGQTAEKLAEKLVGIERGVWICKTMQEAVERAHELARGGSVLFSPAFSSFGMFDGYAERGKSFENAVLCLKNQKL